VQPWAGRHWRMTAASKLPANGVVLRLRSEAGS